MGVFAINFNLCEGHLQAECTKILMDRQLTREQNQANCTFFNSGGKYVNEPLPINTLIDTHDCFEKNI
jgi:hypothetical protein